MMRETLGQNAVDDVIKANEERILSRYSEEMKELEDLEKRIEKLASIRSREGYMADYKKDEEGYLFVENHCPICSAAETCQGFCKAELEVFQQVLGKEASVERVEHIVKGARRCAYRITPTN
jgi:radical SAM protein with 4Fe4S-binding SPASM domain